MAAPNVGPAPVVAPEVKTEFTVSLDGFDPPRRSTLSKWCARSLVLVEGGQGPGRGVSEAVKENLPKEEAEALKKKLEDGGAKVSLK